MADSISYTVNRPEVIDEKFDDEFVIVNLKTGAYYGLRGTGAFIWEMVVGGATDAEMATGLAECFDADPTTLSRALVDLLRELEEETLITPHHVTHLNTPNATVAEPRPTGRAPFSAPILEKHLDMQEVLLLDPIHEVDDAGWPSKKV